MWVFTFVWGDVSPVSEPLLLLCMASLTGQWSQAYACRLTCRIGYPVDLQGTQLTCKIECLLLAWLAFHWGALEKDVSYFYVAVFAEPLDSTTKVKTWLCVPLCTWAPAVVRNSASPKVSWSVIHHRISVDQKSWNLCANGCRFFGCLSINTSRSVSAKMLEHSLDWSHFCH